MKRILIGMLAAVTLLAFGISSGHGTGDVQAASPGTTNAPLLSCADVDGSGGLVDLFNDIFGVAFLFGADADDVGSGEPDGYHPLYDVGDGSGQIDLFNDIFGVAFDFGNTCPLVDTQLAQATLVILSDPDAAQFLTENPTFLASRGYLRGAQDLPGHGIHYVNLSLMDGMFSPTQPEGLAYNNGKLVSYVYYADGDEVGWGGLPTHSNNVNIDAFCTPVPPNTACSFSGMEDGWHDHAWLCIWNIGTPEAVAYAPLAQADCESTGGLWDERSGWMLHVHNHTLNPNGRFANCFPDVQGWKAYNCPQ